MNASKNTKLDKFIRTTTNTQSRFGLARGKFCLFSTHARGSYICYTQRIFLRDTRISVSVLNSLLWIEREQIPPCSVFSFNRISRGKSTLGGGGTAMQNTYSRFTPGKYILGEILLWKNQFFFCFVFFLFCFFCLFFSEKNLLGGNSYSDSNICAKIRTDCFELTLIASERWNTLQSFHYLIGCRKWVRTITKYQWNASLRAEVNLLTSAVGEYFELWEELITHF